MTKKEQQLIDKSLEIQTIQFKEIMEQKLKEQELQSFKRFYVIFEKVFRSLKEIYQDFQYSLKDNITILKQMNESKSKNEIDLLLSKKITQIKYYKDVISELNELYQQIKVIATKFNDKHNTLKTELKEVYNINDNLNKALEKQDMALNNIIQENSKLKNVNTKLISELKLEKQKQKSTKLLDSISQKIIERKTNNTVINEEKNEIDKFLEDFDI